MASPMFNAFGGGSQNDIVSRFNQFRQNFRGDPRQHVQQLLNSGRVTQEQYNRAVQMTSQLQKMLGWK